MFFHTENDCKKFWKFFPVKIFEIIFVGIDFKKKIENFLQSISLKKAFRDFFGKFEKTNFWQKNKKRITRKKLGPIFPEKFDMNFCWVLTCCYI